MPARPESFRGWRENIRANVPRMLASPPALELRGARRGDLGVVAGAGPSLRLNGHLLRAPRPGVTVVACDRAYGVLGRADVVVSADAGERAGRALRDGARTHEVALGCVFAPHAYPDTVQAWRGPTWWLCPQQSTRMVEEESAEALARCAVTPGAGTVVADGVMAALLLGCNPIALVGVDCSWSADATHADGSGAAAPRVPGGGLRTTRSLMLYASEIERLARGLRGIGVTLANASEAGLLHLAGVVPPTRLAHALLHGGASLFQVGPVQAERVKRAV